MKKNRLKLPKVNSFGSFLFYLAKLCYNNLAEYTRSDIMIILRLSIVALIGAVIGWITNIIAIKLIFRPLNPIKLPIINYTLQGLIPKRKEELAESIGNVVENELLSMNEIADKLIKEENLSQIVAILKTKINRIVNEKLPSLLPSAFKNMISSYIDELVEKEGEVMIKDLAQKVVDKAIEEISISDLVKEKINNFELDKIEKIILSISSKELKHIEVLGGLLGFVIGIVQGLMMLLF